MPTLRYSYINKPGSSLLRPVAPFVATNIRNGISQPFLAIVDTGADGVSLCEEMLRLLGIDRDSLKEFPMGGAGGRTTRSWYCDYVTICFLEVPSLEHHYPNGGDPVPMFFTPGYINLVGHDHFLELCRACFDGPNRETHIDF